jgi:hypothetical protein
MSVLHRAFLALLFPSILLAQGDSIIAIVGGTLIDGNGDSPLPNATVLVHRGRRPHTSNLAAEPLSVAPKARAIHENLGKSITRIPTDRTNESLEPSHSRQTSCIRKFPQDFFVIGLLTETRTRAREVHEAE